MTAASCESSRRRRASPHMRYSGRLSTSSATNIVSRSLAATNVIIPASANSVNGKTSVCIVGAWPGSAVIGLVGRPRRSARAPPPAAARAAADAMNAPPGSTDRSAMSSTLPRPSASRVPQRNRVGRSTASASAIVVRPCGGLVPAYAAERDARHRDGDDRQHHLRGPALVARQERLDEHRDARRRQDDQQRQQRARSRSTAPRSAPGPAREGSSLDQSSHRVGQPDLVHGAHDRRVDHIQHRAGEEPEHQDQRRRAG